MKNDFFYIAHHEGIFSIPGSDPELNLGREFWEEFEKPLGKRGVFFLVGIKNRGCDMFPFFGGFKF